MIFPNIPSTMLTPVACFGYNDENRFPLRKQAITREELYIIPCNSRTYPVYNFSTPS